MEAALGAGLAIECDLQMSRDNVPMVFHDWELDRLTDERGLVAQRPARDLERIALRGSQDRIWRLEELLSLVNGRAPILLEVKSRPDFAIIEAAMAVSRILAGYDGPVAVMSFDPRLGEWFASRDPDMLRGLVATDTLDHGFRYAWRQPNALDRAQPDFLASDVHDLPNAITDLWRANGRPLLTWTVRTPALRARGREHADALIAEKDGLP